MLIYDEPLLSGQMPVPEGGCIMEVAEVFLMFLPSPPPPRETTNGLFTFFVANCEEKKLPKTTKTTTATTK